MSDQAKPAHLAQKLKDLGYVGATGHTPYKLPTPEQLAELQRVYADTNFTNVPRTVPPGAVSINVNFDGTHNNGAYMDPAKGEFPTNIYQLSKLQEDALGTDPLNTIYLPGVGAQTMPSDAVHPASGNPMREASPSYWAALPGNAGAAAKVILEDAYDKLSTRITNILAENPNADIRINLSGFSRGAAQAVAFANLLNEGGIGPFKPGDVRIANMLLLDPVDQTNRALNVKPPTNVDNTLVMVATGEGRSIMPAMAVSQGARVQGINVAHSGLGGSYNPQGTAAVVLQKSHEFYVKGGVPMADIPSNLKPDWQQMYIHNSSVDNYGVPKLGANEETWENKPSRWYEGASRHAPSVQETLGKLSKDIESNQNQASGYPKLDWQNRSTPLRVFNEADGTSKVFMRNSDGVVVNSKQLDVNGVEVSPKQTLGQTRQMNLTPDNQARQTQIKLQPPM